MKSHIYLLLHRNGCRFKIGKANDIIRRARCFGLSEIDWSGSAGYVVGSAREALNLERILLRTFDQWRLSSDEVVEDGGGVDGATEWIRSDHRERVEAFLLHLSDVIPHERICGDRLNQEVTALLAPIRQANAERALRLEQKRQRDAVQDEIRRVRALESHAVLEGALERAAGAFWCELARHVSMGTIVGMSTGRYGWSLVLLQENVVDRVWHGDSREFHFQWPGGGGGLVNSVLEIEACDVRVCIVGLGSSFSEAWPSRTITEKVLGRATRFLRTLDEIDIDEIEAWSCWGFVDEENEALERHRRRVLDIFIDEQIQKVHERRARAMTGQLFEVEVGCT